MQLRGVASIVMGAYDYLDCVEKNPTNVIAINISLVVLRVRSNFRHSQQQIKNRNVELPLKRCHDPAVKNRIVERKMGT
jgi:hypothetical protein